MNTLIEKNYADIENLTKSIELLRNFWSKKKIEVIALNKKLNR
jgi:hypothetical protein